MFKNKKNKPSEIEQDGAQSEKKNRNWLKISLIVNIVLVVGVGIALTAMGILHQSDTNPNFCATCHNMENNVNSYLTSDNLDHVHAEANIECKDCHDYPVSAEITSGIRFITGNYDKDMPKQKYDDDMCLQCHISMDYLATQTDYLTRNPHASHWPDLKCRNCHISHGEQVDTCSECHDNGGQRMTGDPTIPRANNPYDDYPDSEETTVPVH